MELLKKHEPNRNTLRAAIELWGEDHQQNKALEEMTELSKEILKFKEGKGDKEALEGELADVYITLRQLELMMDISDWHRHVHIDAKMKRLENTIKEEKQKRAASEKTAHRVDCSQTMNYVKERDRMCEYYSSRKGCPGCPLYGLGDDELVRNTTQEYIDILQKWSDENPPEEATPC